MAFPWLFGNINSASNHFLHLAHRWYKAGMIMVRLLYHENKTVALLVGQARIYCALDYNESIRLGFHVDFVHSVHVLNSTTYGIN